MENERIEEKINESEAFSLRIKAKNRRHRARPSQNKSRLKFGKLKHAKCYCLERKVIKIVKTDETFISFATFGGYFQFSRH